MCLQITHTKYINRTIDQPQPTFFNLFFKKKKKEHTVRKFRNYKNYPFTITGNANKKVCYNNLNTHKNQFFEKFRTNKTRANAKVTFSHRPKMQVSYKIVHCMSNYIHVLLPNKYIQVFTF